LLAARMPFFAPARRARGSTRSDRGNSAVARPRACADSGAATAAAPIPDEGARSRRSRGARVPRQPPSFSDFARPCTPSESDGVRLAVGGGGVDAPGAPAFAVRNSGAPASIAFTIASSLSLRVRAYLQVFAALSAADFTPAGDRSLLQ